MADLFKNAFTGKAYKTRDGRKVFYLGVEKVVCFWIGDDYIHVTKEGKDTFHLFLKSGNDIISEWEE